MTMFCVANDDVLVDRIMAAQSTIILIAPGIHDPVAKALAARLQDFETLRITLVLDGGEDVCRIGFGDIDALRLIHRLAAANSDLSIRSQPGLRVGVLISDDETIMWAPTPRSVEAAPSCDPESDYLMPNGLLLDRHVGSQVAWAIGAEGTDTTPGDAEIGKEAITPAQVEAVEQILRDNPPIPVDLQRITRVFSTKLQFVELEVKGASLSRRKLTLSNAQINADAGDLVREMLESGFRPFADFKDRQISVPIFVGSEQAFDKNGDPLEEGVTEAQLNRERKAIEADFLYDISGFGRLIERDRKQEFQNRLNAYKARMEAHATGLRQIVQAEMETVIQEIANLIVERGARMGSSVDREQLLISLSKQISLADEAQPVVRCVFKDVTHEQTQDADFRQKVDKALSASVKKRLGNWYNEFSAAKQGSGGQS